MRTVRITVALAALLVAAGPAGAQRSPFLSDGLHRLLVNEISGDIAYEHLRWLTHYHRPMGGSEGYQAVERYVEQKAREYGLEDVRVIKLKTDTPSWSPKVGELWLIEPELRRLAYSKEVVLSLADYSRDADVPSAGLVDVGEGTSDADYQGKDVAGNIVLASGSLARVMDEAVWKRGALGIVAFTAARVPDHPDQYPWMRIPVQNADGSKKGTFAFVLQNREGERLRRQLRSAKTPFKVRAKVEATWRKPPVLTMTGRERELAGRIPAIDVTVQQFLDRRRKQDRPRTLHSLMAYEAMNFVDGARSVLDIFRAVSAEADAAGDWYYGAVTLEDVAAYLESAEKAGIVRLQTAGTKTESRR